MLARAGTCLGSKQVVILLHRQARARSKVETIMLAFRRTLGCLIPGIVLGQRFTASAPVHV
jgi:hypothetical protein